MGREVSFIKFSKLYYWKGETYRKGRYRVRKAAQEFFGFVPRGKDELNEFLVIEFIETTRPFDKIAFPVDCVRRTGYWPYDKRDLPDYEENHE